MDEYLDRADSATINGQPWQRLLPIATVPDKVKFTPEELTSLMLVDMELFNDIGPSDDIHNNLLMVFELYKTKRMALTDTLPAKMRGSVGTIELTDSEKLLVAPKMAELNILVEGMVQRTKQDSKEAWKILEKLRTSLNK